MAARSGNKKKSGNKHATNTLRSERKYKRSKQPQTWGKCGSRFCGKSTGCEPWRSV